MNASTSSDRFEMAEAVVEWARKRLKELAPYQYASIQFRTATDDYRIAVSEILSHLKSALDYCARELHARFVGGKPPEKIYFPISSRKGTEQNFLSIVCKNIAGIKGHSKVVDLLKSFQFFANPANNGWLPDLATLCNQCKHEQLAVQCREPVKIGIGPEKYGRPVYTFHRSDKIPLRAGFMIDLGKVGESGMSEGGYFKFDAINYEVNSFLNTAIDRVGGIVQQLKSCV